MSPPALPHNNLLSPPPEPHCSTSQVENVQPNVEAKSSSSAMAGGPSQVLEKDPRVEDRSPNLACSGTQVESMPETQEPGTAEAAPSIADALLNCESQIRSTSGEVEEDVDYRDGIDDSKDIQVFKV